MSALHDGEALLAPSTPVQGWAVMIKGDAHTPIIRFHRWAHEAYEDFKSVRDARKPECRHQVVMVRLQTVIEGDR